MDFSLEEGFSFKLASGLWDKILNSQNKCIITDKLSIIIEGGGEDQNNNQVTMP